MRIDIQRHSNNKIASQKLNDSQMKELEDIDELKVSKLEVKDETSYEQMKQAVDSINEIFEINNSELKFVFHEGLEEYFVQLVDSNTEEVVREIPSKKLLDVFYEMQKLVGMIVDEKI
ncbi:flagellar protein FlaG [Lysinibacillus fusiformis]|nr:flagellar protein FlaG [Lysinibacillus fusiformis]